MGREDPRRWLMIIANNAETASSGDYVPGGGARDVGGQEQAFLLNMARRGLCFRFGEMLN
jgi:hypothetical protein